MQEILKNNCGFLRSTFTFSSENVIVVYAVKL